MSDEILQIPQALVESGICWQFIEQLKDQSERAQAIVAAAALDDVAKRLIEVVVVNKRIARRLVGHSNAPLGTFSARIDALYAFRVISRDQWKVLNTIREIRNKFAHEVNWSFSEESTRDKCLSLHQEAIVYPEGEEDNPRIRFIMNASGICGALDTLRWQWSSWGFQPRLLEMNIER